MTGAWRPRLRHTVLVGVFLVLPALLPGQRPASEAWDSLGPEARMRLGLEAHTRRALADGRLPLWNPYHLGGRPHLADPGTLALYPPHVVLRFLPIDAFFTVSFLVHAWTFAIGAYLVARQLGASRAPSLLASTGAMLASFLMPGADLRYSPALYSLAWLPLIVALSMRSVERSGLRPHPGLVAAAAMAITGLPRGQAYAAAAVAGCYLFAVLWPGPREGRRQALLMQLTWLVCVVAGLSAFQLVPQLRLLTTASWAGGLVGENVRDRATFDSRPGLDRLLTATLSPRDGYRVLSRCDDALDASRFLWLGAPTVEGYGGPFPADYGRFAGIVSGTRDEPSLAPATMRASPRTDLQALLSAGYLVTCSPPDPDGWDVVGESDGAILARARHVLPRAFWTCAPRPVTRRELDYRLRNYRYDETMTLREALPVIHVRWADDVDESARLHAEAMLKIRPRRVADGATWEYDLVDPSRANLAAIVGHPAVEDTAGFERGTLALPPLPEPPPPSGRRSEWLLGLEPCEEVRPATIEQLDRADGHLIATVDAPRDGLVFLSETYFEDRAAWLDGTPVDPLKVNLAFTGIPVTAGTHRIELRADAASFWTGAGVTVLTLIAWTIHGWRAHRR